MGQYFEFCDELKFDDHVEVILFERVSDIVVVTDGTRFTRQLRKIGFRNYKFLDNEGEFVSYISRFRKSCNSFEEQNQHSFQMLKDLLVIKRKSKTEGKVHMGFKDGTQKTLV